MITKTMSELEAELCPKHKVFMRKIVGYSKKICLQCEGRVELAREELTFLRELLKVERIWVNAVIERRIAVLEVEIKNNERV